ncbi:hypothetical protein ACD661_16475 [Legionella lytica]|uniref:Uncharacterized protein n=1 Tax=Legionella lytica TaxID=96232 RepID=A0ABW8DBQ1_9GAMM
MLTPFQSMLLKKFNNLRANSLEQGFDQNGIKVILHMHNLIHPNKNPIMLIEQEDMLDVIKATVSFSQSQDMRHQFIVKLDNHYFAIDIERDNQGGFQALILDAGGDHRTYKLLTTLADMVEVNKVYVAIGKTAHDNIQKDLISCPVFSLDHARDIQSMDIYGYIEKSEVEKSDWSMMGFSNKLRFIPWTDMHPEINKNCQSSGLWEKYKNEYTKKFNPPEGYFNQYELIRKNKRERSEAIDQACKMNPGNIIPAVFEAFADSARQFISQSSDLEIKSIFKNSTLNFKTISCLQKIEELINNIDWKKRTGTDTPKHIAWVKKVLEDTNIDHYDKIEKIREIAISACAPEKKFLFFTSSLSSNPLITQVYGTLRTIDISNENSLSKATQNLDKILEEFSIGSEQKATFRK